MPATPSTGSRRTGLILLLGTLAALGPFAIDTYLPAFPAIAADLHVDTGKVGLSLSAYFLGICLGQLGYGPILDRYGRRIPLLFGLGLFALASLLCATAPRIEALIALRFLQALGGCAGMVAGRTLVRDLFPRDAANVFGTLMLVMGIAPIVAPSLGELMTGTVGWRAIFLFLAGVSLCVLVLVAVFLPPTHAPDPSHSLRPSRIAGGYLAVLKERDFLTYGVAGALIQAGMFAYLAASPGLYMQALGWSRTHYAWIFALNAIGLIAASQCNGVWLRKATSESIVSTMLQVQSVIALAVLLAGALLPSLLPFTVWGFLFCQGFFMPNLSALAMRPFHRNAGSASALMGSIQMALGALLSALVSFLPAQAPTTMGIGCCVTALGGGFLVHMASSRR